MAPASRSETAPRTADQAPIFRKLWRAERQRFQAHLQRLEPDDRCLRFCSPVTDALIRDYCARIDPWKTTILGCFIDGALRGAAELVRAESATSDSAELALMVERPFQDRGIGTSLMGKSLTLARNRYVDTVVMVCLAENRKMLHIARKFGAELEFGGGEIEGRLRPAYPTIISIIEEAAMEGQAMFRASFEIPGPTR